MIDSLITYKPLVALFERRFRANLKCRYWGLTLLSGNSEILICNEPALIQSGH